MTNVYTQHPEMKRIRVRKIHNHGENGSKYNFMRSTEIVMNVDKMLAVITIPMFTKINKKTKYYNFFLFFFLIPNKQKLINTKRRGISVCKNPHN